MSDSELTELAELSAMLLSQLEFEQDLLLESASPQPVDISRSSTLVDSHEEPTSRETAVQKSEEHNIPMIVLTSPSGQVMDIGMAPPWKSIQISPDIIERYYAKIRAARGFSNDTTRDTNGKQENAKTPQSWTPLSARINRSTEQNHSGFWEMIIWARRKSNSVMRRRRVPPRTARVMARAFTAAILGSTKRLGYASSSKKSANPPENLHSAAVKHPSSVAS
ncbi:hypothetical protein V8C42DRAFT_7455 [Trichoderma barbatum]